MNEAAWWFEKCACVRACMSACVHVSMREDDTQSTNETKEQEEKDEEGMRQLKRM